LVVDLAEFMKDKLTILFGFIILTAGIAAVLFYGIDRFYNLRVIEIQSQFDFQCAQTYRYTETLGDGVVVSYPMQKEYKDCVNSKGNLN